MQINEQNPAVYQAAPARLPAQKVLAQWLRSCWHKESGAGIHLERCSVAAIETTHYLEVGHDNSLRPHHRTGDR
jgi:hypothetical protein